MSRCARCGRELVSLEDLARESAGVADAALRLSAAFAAMRLTIPQRFIEALHELERKAPQLATWLACVGGTCDPPAG